MIDRFVLYLLLAGCAVFGAILFIEIDSPVATDPPVLDAPTRLPVTSAAEPRRRPRLDELLATTLTRPLFSASRRPAETAKDDSPTGPDLADPRLTGIVTEPGRRIAIFAVSGAKALTLGEGGTVSGWRIVTITPSEIALNGPGGTRTLQPKIDPSLPTSPPPPPLPPFAAGRLPPQPGTAISVQFQPAVPPMQPRQSVPPGLQPRRRE